MTVKVLCGVGSHNVGDELIVDTLTSRLLGAFPACRVEFLTYGIGEDYPERHIRSLWRDPRRALCGADVLLVGPGGVFPGLAVPGQWAPPEAHIQPAWLPKLTFGVGIGYTPLATDVPEAVPCTQNWLGRMCWAWARDSVLVGLAEHCTAAPDVAYLAAGEFLAMRVPEADRSGVVVVPCSETPGLRQAICEAIGTHARPGEHVTLLAASASAGENDRRLCEEVAAGIGASATTDVLTWREFARRVARCRLLITARAPPAIMADMLGVPYVSVDPWDKLAPIAAVSGATWDARTPEEILGAHSRACAGFDELVRRLFARGQYHEGAP